MGSLLRTAGAPKSALDLIHSVCSSCAVCRQWQRPSSKAVHSTRTSTRFNECLQIDLLFVLTHILVHMCDECTRFSMACLIENKQPESITAAIASRWIAYFGSPEVIMSDKEGGIASEIGSVWAERMRTSIRLKAVGQHASTVERHNALLRDVIHKILGQLQTENLEVGIEEFVASAVVAKNSMLEYGGHAPYTAVLGRISPVLQGLDETSVSALDDAAPGPARHCSRLREIAVQAVV